MKHGTLNTYRRHGCRCEDCTEVNREHNRKQYAKRLTRGLGLEDPRHGTSSGYTNWGCRCDSCSSAVSGYWRTWKYGVDPEWFETTLASQNGHCAACPTREPDGKGWHIDHDHDTNEVRGILCGPCNQALGYAREDAARLRGLATYIERFKPRLGF